MQTQAEDYGDVFLVLLVAGLLALSVHQVVPWIQGFKLLDLNSTYCCCTADTANLGFAVSILKHSQELPFLCLV